jgi:hypothetical protein
VGKTIISHPMVNIPPIKMVMTGGWFMALFYPHILYSFNPEIKLKD